MSRKRRGASRASPAAKRLATASGESVVLDRGRIDLVSVETFTQRLPEIPIPSLPFMGAYGIKVASLAALAELLQRAGLATRRSQHGLIVLFPEELGHGAWLFAE